MQEFVEVVFRSDRIGFFINNKQLELSPDLNVVVKVERGEDIGRVSNCAVLDDNVVVKVERGEDIGRVSNCAVLDDELIEKNNQGEINKILRIATEEDLKQLEIVKKKEQKAKVKFLEILKKQPFQMKLLEHRFQGVCTGTGYRV
jgi:cell fate regulator YaaT (PSP1 superfamily)